MAISRKVHILTENQSDIPQHFANDECIVHLYDISSMADRWHGSNRRFWSNPFLIFPDTPVINSTIFILTFHILLTSITKSLYLLNFSVFFVLKFESSGMAS
jgi:hypothetical protein